MSLEWNDAYKIGNAEIDAQHQELFGLANKFLNATDKGSLSVCAMSFFKYTRQHFKHEEGLMEKLRYPGTKGHIAEHSKLISRLGSVAEGIANETLNFQELESFISAWLNDHIGTSDKQLAAYVILQE
jgi:hemerythrin-like metal-binding protein